MDTLPKSEDPDEMPHYAAFHQVFALLVKVKQSSGKELQ